MTAREPERTAAVDSESWACRRCGGTFIGKRPADDTCASCVVTEVTTEPAENPPPLSRDLSGDLLGLPGGRPPGCYSTAPGPCSDASCPVHGHELSPAPDYEPDGTERPGLPRVVAGPPIDLGVDPDGDSTPDWPPTEAELAADKAAADERRRDSIRTLTPDQCRRVLRFLAGYEPRGFDYALEWLAGDEAAARERSQGARAGGDPVGDDMGWPDGGWTDAAEPAEPATCAPCWR